MTPKHLVLSALSLAWLSGCASLPPEEHAKYTEESRATVGELIKKTAGVLKADMDAQGPAAAISVCKDKAPQIAKAIMAEKGVKVRRVTTKNRNPNSVPDAWEAKVLAEFEQRLARGEQATSLEYTEVVKEDGQKVFRYMKGLPVMGLCMTCHGTDETIPADVKAKLAELYPNDKATGYKPNMLRGAVSLKKPL